ncbi:MAG: LD-carboxypeptidase [Acidobacteria bacterium]|nr:LD-carboxypeptidase [Acidobacteriota bacterium]
MAETFLPLGATEPVGVVALSSPVDRDRFDAGLEALKSLGRPVVVAPNLWDRSALGTTAGEDARRVEGLEAVLDAGARVIVAARGGFGVTRILEALPWERLIREQVVFVGFSDLTALFNPLVAAGGSIQVHGPMVAVGMDRAVSRRRLFDLLEGRLTGRTLFRFAPSDVVRGGCAAGRAIGGNLAVLCSLLGTRFEPEWEGAVLFIEDVGEPLYRLDRLLTHLKTAGRLNRVEAVVSGRLHRCGQVAKRAWARLVAEAVGRPIPIVTGLPFGHGAKNMAFPLGAGVEVDTKGGYLLWRD